MDIGKADLKACVRLPGPRGGRRRHVIKAGAFGGVALLVPAAAMAPRRVFADPVPGGTLDPNKIPKYVLPLFTLPAMPGGRTVGGVDYHEIAVRQFSQRILHTSYDQFAVGSSVPHFLPLLAERFARQRLTCGSQLDWLRGGRPTCLGWEMRA